MLKAVFDALTACVAFESHLSIRNGMSKLTAEQFSFIQSQENPMWDTKPSEYMGSSGGRSAPMGSCTWQYNGSEWVLSRVDAKNGGVPSAAPATPGKFKGHLRVTPCVAAQEVQTAS